VKLYTHLYLGPGLRMCDALLTFVPVFVGCCSRVSKIIVHLELEQDQHVKQFSKNLGGIWRNENCKEYKKK
jgi:hypothetical protein